LKYPDGTVSESRRLIVGSTTALAGSAIATLAIGA
jgi:hypothetical protein